MNVACSMNSIESCTDTPHIEETLTVYHEKKMTEMVASGNLFDYLLDAAEYIKNEDLIGWKEKFQERPIVIKKPTKRLRQSPAQAPVCPEELCVECKSDSVIDDVENGQLVCLSCGLIQLQGVFTADTAHCTYDRMQTMGRVHIHRYSRVSNFMTVIRFAAGDTNPVISEETLLSLRVELGGRPINEYEVRKALCRLGLSRRYRRHAMSLVRKWDGETNIIIPGDVVMAMCKMFRRVEFFFDKQKRTIWPGRKTFFSYNFMIYQLLHELNCSEFTGSRHLLKSEKLLNIQRGAYKKICEFTGYKLY
jgi:hypothetical protein